VKFLMLVLAVVVGTATAQEVDTLKVQVLLDRAHFSVGEIDDRRGSNTKGALRAFQAERQLAVTGELDQDTLKALDDGQPVLKTHTLTAEDVAGPFIGRVPGTMLGKSKLRRVGYANALEKIGELFQSSPALLKRLNPEAQFVAGETITVPAASNGLSGTVAKIVVTRSEKSLRLYDAAGRLLAYYPTTLGSAQSPPPYGTWRVAAITPNPYYNYDPARFVSPGTPTKVTVPPGPNNPVGVMWIALSARHYGIHGTPEPSKISKTQSNGCIRLTNWDALEVASVTSKDTVVLVQR
jgi:lipoprotein-anchoring transpeptidase ErfK/SrfK